MPYTLLTILFDYPHILREDAGLILTRFHIEGTRLVVVWWLFAMVGLPILEAYILIGQRLEKKIYFVRWATSLAVISGVVQIIALLRWTFVVPVLANSFVTAPNESVRVGCKIAFQVLNQYGGVALGEHIGQLFTIAWIFMISSAFHKLKLMPNWVTWFGYISASIYLLAQGELFATVIPGFPVWEMAGLIGSSLWLIWMILVGIFFMKVKID